MVHHPEVELISRVVGRPFPPSEAGENGETGEDPESRPKKSVTVRDRGNVG